MIKNSKKVGLPNVELGNLTVQNASRHYIDSNLERYPLCIFARGTFQLCRAEHISEKPKGYRIHTQYDIPEERLLDYAKQLKEEHAGISDEIIRQDPGYNGRKRNARWFDERKRRGI